MTVKEKKRRRHWLRFRLLTLLAFVSTCAVFMAWFACEINRTKRQQAVVDSIHRLGGSVQYDFEYDDDGIHNGLTTPSTPAWIRKLGGNYVFCHVVSVNLYGTSFDNNRMQCLRPLANIRDLLLGNTEISDSALEHLNGMGQLQFLALNETRITDNGLKCLAAQQGLRQLSLEDTRITDEGLRHLAGLLNLEVLHLQNTRVTDKGLGHLAGLQRLEYLDLRNTAVTEDGVSALKESIPKCLVLYGNDGTQFGAQERQNKNVAADVLPV